MNFLDFVAARQARPVGEPQAPAEEHETPYLPGFDERERPLTADALEHRRRMLVHLASTSGR